MRKDEIKAELAALREVMVAGFVRADRYFELQQGQFIEFRDQVAAEFGEVRSRLDALTVRVDLLEQEVRSLRGEFSTFRDLVAREFAEVRGELCELRQVSARHSAEVKELGARLERLEQYWKASGGMQTGSSA